MERKEAAARGLHDPARDSMMSIKYHDNMTPPKYGPDHTVSNNWNPDADYGNDYVHVYFRINAPAYYRGANLGFSPEEHDRFYQEVGTVFRSLGWDTTSPGKGHGCMDANKGKAHLYLHPQEFSGEMLKREVRALAEALEKHDSFSLELVDLYQTAYDMTDEDYYAYLRRQTERIRAEILAESQTARRSLFYRDYSIACTVASKVKLRRVGEDDGEYSGGAGKTANFVVGLIPQLINEGYLVSITDRDGSRMIRTINKTEQRQRKLKVA